MRTRALLALPAAAVLALTACGGSSSDGAAASSSVSGSASGGLSGTLTVFAAASLTDVFPRFGKHLEDQQPGLHVRFAFAGSSQLATQLTKGAPADVFASANESQMKVVTAAGLPAGDPTIFTENVLEIAVPKGNPAQVTGLADFATPTSPWPSAPPTCPVAPPRPSARTRWTTFRRG